MNASVRAIRGLRLPSGVEDVVSLEAGATLADSGTRHRVLWWLAEHPRIQQVQGMGVDGPMTTVRFEPGTLRVVVIQHRHGGSALRLDGFNRMGLCCARRRWTDIPCPHWDPVFMTTDFSEYTPEGGYTIDRLLDEVKVRHNDMRTLPDGTFIRDALGLKVLTEHLVQRP